MNCAYHLTNRAVVQCSRCTRPLCPACDHRIRGFPYCQDCIVAGVESLQHQQARVAAKSVVRRKSSPFVAALLSFLCPGLGAAYNGQTAKALVHFTIFASFLQMLVVTDGGVLFFWLGLFATWLFTAVDAARTAQLIRAGLAPDAESDAITRRLYGNPLAWAMTMMSLGLIFLLHTVFNMRLPAKFLPIIPVIIGAYMLFDYFRTRRQRDPLRFEGTGRAPSLFGSAAPASGSLAAAGEEVTRFGTGELVTQVSARDRGFWPNEPRA